MTSVDTIKNKNKIIDIKLTDPSNTTDDVLASWKGSLRRIMSAAASNNHADYSNIIGDINLSSDLTVLDANVDLLMGDDPPEFEIEEAISYPIQDILRGGSSDLGKITQGSTAADLVSNILGHANTIFNAASAIGGALNGSEGTTNVFNPWFSKYPAWDVTKNGPISFTYRFDFKLGQYGLWNAKEEVVLPILNLMAPTLAQNISTISQAGPFPGAMQLLVGMISSTAGNLEDTLSTVLSLDADALAESLQALLLEQTANYAYTVKFGDFYTFRRCFMTKSNTRFSKETDQFGYPISGSIELKFITIVPAALTYENENIRSIRFGVK